jgi:DNA polymerase
MIDMPIDFETRSASPLPRVGAYRYAEHESTDVWCLAFEHPEVGTLLWEPGCRPDVHAELRVLAASPTIRMRAWNVQFERAIWRIMARRYGMPDIPVERWICTAAEARAMGLPNKLEDAARVLGVQEQKDMAGHRLMMQMSKPRAALPDGTYRWWDDADRRRRLGEYCVQDVKTESAVKRCLQPLSEVEAKVFLMDQRANDRGIMLDRELANSARAVADAVLAKAGKDLGEITDGAVQAVTQVGQLKAWMGTQGFEVSSLSKKAVAQMLSDEFLPLPIREALEVRVEAGKSSIGKVDAMLRAVCADDMLRGLLLYWGAGTGRWAGRLVQPQNFPARTAGLPGWAVDDLFEHPGDFIQAVLRRDVKALEMTGPALEIIALLLRSMLRARPGHVLVAADYAAIEAVVIAWLCGEEWRLEVFRTHGKIYEASASMMFKIPLEEITKKHPARQKGKAAELALGFEGGVNALITMGALEMGLAEEELPDIVRLWREASPNIKAGWKTLNNAARTAVKFPGKVVGCLSDRVRFKSTGGWLWLKLPSGRRLAYCQPKIVSKPAPWDKSVMLEGVEAWSVNSKTRKWSKRSLYGGLLMENIVQATARDIMADAMLRAEAGGVYMPLLSVHDEIVAEAPEGRADLKEFEHLLCDLPAWAAGCPIRADGWIGPRYTK